jgi:hypothetical protein
MTGKSIVRAELEAEREALVPHYLAAKQAGELERLGELEAAAARIDALLDQLAIGDLIGLAADLAKLREDLSALTKKARAWPFNSSDPAAEVGTKTTPQTKDDDVAAAEHKVLPKPGEAAVAADGSGWRVAESLLRLKAQVDDAAPNRSTASDGTIGDKNHWPKGADSDHNPWVSDGGQPVVTAIDITHDPARGCDAGLLANSLVASRDPRVKYIIYNRRIISSIVKPWQWRQYNGENPHDRHMHLSVKSDMASYDDTSEWQIGLGAPSKKGQPAPPVEAIALNFNAAEPIAWGKKVSVAFKAKSVEICNRLQLDPNVLMAVMAFETGRTFKASQPAGASSAVGLIQFMPSTAKGLGTTTAKLAAMSDVEQLDYVEQYLKPFTGQLKDTASAYMAVLWPAAVREPESFILFAAGTKQYAANRGLDTDSDGKITKAEAASKVRLALEEGMRPENFG